MVADRAAATWRAPDGLGSSWQDRLDHPVVNVTHEDATEYALGQAPADRGRMGACRAWWFRAAAICLGRCLLTAGKGYLDGQHLAGRLAL